ncbi:MAG: hypothetical protein K0S15_1785 [Solirubrobacterales bacterium]|nr:hypothetical protein [Solirubrobacterales bacterium]
MNRVRGSPAFAILAGMEPLLAHAGHWALWMLYAIPVLIVLAATLNAFLSQRREEREQRGP